MQQRHTAGGWPRCTRDSTFVARGARSHPYVGQRTATGEQVRPACIESGIPSGGLLIGTEVVETEAQQAMWGSVTDESVDPCYH